MDETIVLDWTVAIEALDFHSVQELLELQPNLLWTPLTPSAHLETDFSHFLERLQEFKVLGTSIRPLYALHHILFDYGIEGDEWIEDRNELIDYILKKSTVEELDTCLWGEEQNTIMHLAHFLNRPELIQLLQDKGLDETKTNKLGYLPIDNDQPKIVINKKEKGAASKPSATSDRFRRLRELAESPNNTKNKSKERQNSTRRYFRPGHLEELKRRVLSEEEEAELKEKQRQKRQKEVAQLAERSAVKNNPLFRKFESQQEESVKTKEPIQTKAVDASVKDKSKFLNAAEQVKRSSRVINILKDRSVVSTSVFRQQTDTPPPKKVPSLRALKAGKELFKKKEEEKVVNPTASSTETIKVATELEKPIEEVHSPYSESSDNSLPGNEVLSSPTVDETHIALEEKIIQKNSSQNSVNEDLGHSPVRVPNIETEVESLRLEEPHEKDPVSPIKVPKFDLNLSPTDFQEKRQKAANGPNADKFTLASGRKITIVKKSGNVKKIVNVHENLKEEEKIENYSTGKVFQVWKKDGETLEIAADEYDPNVHVKILKEDDTLISNESSGKNNSQSSKAKTSIDNQKATQNSKTLIKNDLMERFSITEDDGDFSGIHSAHSKEPVILFNKTKIDSDSRDIFNKNETNEETIPGSGLSKTELCDTHIVYQAQGTKSENKPLHDKSKEKSLEKNEASHSLDETSKHYLEDTSSLHNASILDTESTSKPKLLSQEEKYSTKGDTNDYTSSCESSVSNISHSINVNNKNSVEEIGLLVKKEPKVIQHDGHNFSDAQLQMKPEKYYGAHFNNNVLRKSTDSEFVDNESSDIPKNVKDTEKLTTHTPPIEILATETQEKPKEHQKDRETVNTATNNAACQPSIQNTDPPQSYNGQEASPNENADTAYSEYSIYNEFVSEVTENRDTSEFLNFMPQHDKAKNGKIEQIPPKNNSYQKTKSVAASYEEDSLETQNEKNNYKNTGPQQELHCPNYNPNSYEKLGANRKLSIDALAIHTSNASDKNNEYTYNDSQSIASFYSVETEEQSYHTNYNTSSNRYSDSRDRNAIDTKANSSRLSETFNEDAATKSTYLSEDQSFSSLYNYEDSISSIGPNPNEPCTSSKNKREDCFTAADSQKVDIQSNKHEDGYYDSSYYEKGDTGVSFGQKAKTERAHVIPDFLAAENVQNEHFTTQQHNEYKNAVQISSITPNQGILYVENDVANEKTAKTSESSDINRGVKDFNKPMPIITNQSAMFASDDEDATSTPTKENPYGKRDIEHSKNMPYEQFMNVSHGSKHDGYEKTKEIFQNRSSMGSNAGSSKLSETAALHTLSLENEANMLTIADTKGEKAAVPDFLSKPYQSNKEFVAPNEKRKSGSQRNHWSVGINLVEKAPIRDSVTTDSEQWFDPENEWVEEKAYSSHSSMTSDSFKNSSTTGNTTMDEDEDTNPPTRKEAQGTIERKASENELNYYSTSPYQNKTKSYTSSNNEETEGEILIFMQHEDQEHIQTKLEQKNSTTTTIIDREKVQLEETTEVTDQSRVEDISHYMRALPKTQDTLINENKKQSIQAIGTEKINIPNAHELSEHALLTEEIKQSKHGKIYIGVSGAHDVLLPLPKEITYARCVISDGEYEYMSRYEMLGEQILMDYECVIDAKPEMIITVSLHVRPDYHVKPRSGWTKWFTSIRKQKEHLSGYVHPEDGAIGQTRFAVDHMVPACFKKTYAANFDCFNSWYTRSSRERARREQFGDEEDFLKIVSKLNIEMLYLPVSSPNAQVPKSLRECDLTLKIRQWHETCWQNGYLSTRVQGQKIWQRHYYRLVGSQLIGYVSDEETSEVWNHFNIADVIRLSAAADKVIVNLVEQKTKDDRVFGAESIVEGNLKGFFRLSFPDYHLDCISDEVSESEEWVKTLKSMIGRVPLRLPFTEYY